MGDQEPHVSTIEFQPCSEACPKQAVAGSACPRMRVQVLQQPCARHAFDSGLFVWPSAIVLAQWVWHERHRFVGGFARGSADAKEVAQRLEEERRGDDEEKIEQIIRSNDGFAAEPLPLHDIGID